MSAFEADVDDGAPRRVVTVRGEIDLAVADRLDGLTRPGVEDARVDTIVVDLANVTFIDSTGLSALVRLRNACLATQTKLVLRGVTGNPLRVLQLTALDTVFTIEPQPLAP